MNYFATGERQPARLRVDRPGTLGSLGSLGTAGMEGTPDMGKLVRDKIPDIIRQPGRDPALFLQEMPGGVGAVLSELVDLFDEIIDAAGLVGRQGVVLGPSAEPGEPRIEVR
jgi:hypothetical protein